VHLAHPLGVKGFRYRRVKNDVRDAGDLADLLRMGRLPEAWIAPPQTRELRELVRYRAKLVAIRSGLKAQAHAVLAKAGVLIAVSDLFGVGGRQRLAKVPLGAAYAERVRWHEVPGPYPLATFTSPSGLQCGMWSSRGDTAAFCFGPIPGLDSPANQVYAGDYGAHFAQDVPPGTDKLDGKPLAAGEKIVLGAGGTLMGGDQITCGVRGEQVACELIRGFAQNHGGPMAQRHGFVLGPRSSWTY
jgi:Transposase